MECNITYRGEDIVLKGHGNGIVDAFCKALMDKFDITFNVADYSQHSMEFGNKSRAITYVQVYNCRNESYYAVGISSNTAKSSIRAIASAVNQFKKI